MWVTFLQQRISKAQVVDLLEANRVLWYVLRHPCSLVYKPLGSRPDDDYRIVSCADAGFKNADSEASSQRGLTIMLMPGRTAGIPGSSHVAPARPNP